jgi:hypothetical protein
MTAVEWLTGEIEAGRLSASPPDEALSLAADVLGNAPAATTKTPSVELDVLNGENGVAATTRRL